jgi:hypothetical protein
VLREGFVAGSSAIATRGLSGDSKPRWRKCFTKSCSWESSSLQYRRPTMRAGGLGGGPCKIEESKRKPVSVSLVGSPTKPLTRAVRQ